MQGFVFYKGVGFRFFYKGGGLRAFSKGRAKGFYRGRVWGLGLRGFEIGVWGLLLEVDAESCYPMPGASRKQPASNI